MTELDTEDGEVHEEEQVTSKEEEEEQEEEEEVMEEGTMWRKRETRETVSNDDIEHCNCRYTTKLKHTARRDHDEGVQSNFFFWLSVISTFVYTLRE